MPPGTADREPPTPTRPRRSRRLLWAGAAVLLGTCVAAGLVIARGGVVPPAPPSPSPAAGSVAADADLPPTEGPATLPHAWPDGITVRVVGVTRADAGLLPLGPESTANDAGVIVTTEIKNSGSSELRWDASTAVPDGELLYGENRLPAHMHGWDDGTTLPPRLLPGASARWSTIGFLPGTGLGRLAYSMTPRWNDPAHPPWTFTGVGRLLGG